MKKDPFEELEKLSKGSPQRRKTNKDLLWAVLGLFIAILVITLLLVIL